MKKRISLLGILLLTVFLSWAQPDQEALHVTYQVTTNTSYNVSQAVKDNLSLYNKIKFMPSITEDSFDETMFVDGSLAKTIQHDFPNGMPEDWLLKPSQTIITKDSAFVYVENEIYSRFALQPQELVAAEEVAPYYLATPLWKFPISDEEVIALESEGAVIKTNTEILLEYTLDETTFYFNSEWMIEEVSVNDGDRDTEKTTIAYQRDTEGHLLIDFVVHRTLAYDSSINDYVETVTNSNYNNLVRTFIDPALEPEVEYPEEKITSCISASQMVGTQQIQVNFETTCPEGDYLIRVLDLQGNVRMQNIQISALNPVFIAEDLQFGVQVIEVMNHEIPSCSFFYIP